jgi:uncharacterized protein
MVAGEGVVFADLFAADGVLAYPFAPPGQSPELRGRDTIRSYFASRGRSHVTGAPYEFTALGVIRVRDGEIVRYDDYMDALALARLLGRTGELAAALSAS